jgi:hypothetical protein
MPGRQGNLGIDHVHPFDNLRIAEVRWSGFLPRITRGGFDFELNAYWALPFDLRERLSCQLD